MSYRTGETDGPLAARADCMENKRSTKRSNKVKKKQRKQAATGGTTSDETTKHAAEQTQR